MNHTNTKKIITRVWVFDLLRIFLLYLVLHLHVHILTSTPLDFFTPLEMYPVPIFLVLSFFLTAKYFTLSPKTSKIILRLKRLIIPTLFWSLAGFISHPESINFKNILWQLITGHIVNKPIYYMNNLILFTSIAHFLTYVKIKIRIALYMLTIIFAFILQYSQINYHIFIHKSMSLKYSFGRFVELLPYMSTGILLGSYKDVLTKKKYVLILSISSSIAYVFSLYLPNSNGFSYQGLSLYFGALSIFSFIIILTEKAKGTFDVINNLGAYTFGIYLFHFIVLELLLKYIPSIKNLMIQQQNVFLLIFLGGCFGVCLLFDRITKQKFSYLIR